MMRSFCAIDLVFAAPTLVHVPGLAPVPAGQLDRAFNLLRAGAPLLAINKVRLDARGRVTI